MRLGCFRLRMMREFAVEPQADNITVNSISHISLGSPCCMCMGSSSLTASLGRRGFACDKHCVLLVAAKYALYPPDVIVEAFWLIATQQCIGHTTLLSY